MLARLDEALGALDQPTMDGVNTYFASWAARQVGLKVALSGLGGDELFAGYRTFENVPKVEQLIRASWFAPGPSASRAGGPSSARSPLDSGSRARAWMAREKRSMRGSRPTRCRIRISSRAHCSLSPNCRD